MASAPVTLRPLSFGEILDGTFSLYRRYFLLFIGIAAVPQAVLFLVQLVPEASSGATGAANAGIAGTGILIILMILVYAPMVFFSHGANCLAVSEIYLGRTTGITRAYRAVKPAFWGLVGTALLVSLAVALATTIFISVGIVLIITKFLPAILLGVLVILVGFGVAIFLFLRFSLISPVVVLEQESGTGAMSRSAFLLQQNLLRAAGIYLVFGLISIIAAVLFQMPVMMIVGLKAARQATVPSTYSVLFRFAQAISSTLVAPLFYIGITLLYYDTRVRKEAFDLQLMTSLIRRRSETPDAIQP